MIISLAFTQLFLEDHIEPEEKNGQKQHLAEKWFILTGMEKMEKSKNESAFR